jgi:capsular polysaccharide biosynthesis protein
MQSSRIQPKPAVAVSTAVRARLALISFGAAAGALLGITYAVVAPTAYQAQTTLRVGQGMKTVDEPQGSSADPVGEAVVAGSETVLAELHRRLEYAESVERLRQHLVVINPPDTGLLVFKFSAESSRDAEKGAAAAAQIYMKLRTRELGFERDTNLRQLQRLLTQVETRPAASRAARLERRDVVRTVQLQIAQQDVVVLDAGSIVEAAAGTAKSHHLNWGISAGAGLLAGLALAALAAYLLESIAPRVRRATDPSQWLPITYLGQVSAKAFKTDAVARLTDAAVVARQAGGDKIGVLGVGVEEPFLGRLIDCVPEAATGGPDRLISVSPLDLDDRAFAAKAAGQDAVLLVATEDQTRIRSLDAAIQRLEVLGIKLAGIVTITRKGKPGRVGR